MSASRLTSSTTCKLQKPLNLMNSTSYTCLFLLKDANKQCSNFLLYGGQKPQSPCATHNIYIPSSACTIGKTRRHAGAMPTLHQLLPRTEYVRFANKHNPAVERNISDFNLRAEHALFHDTPYVASEKSEASCNRHAQRRTDMFALSLDFTEFQCLSSILES